MNARKILAGGAVVVSLTIASAWWLSSKSHRSVPAAPPSIAATMNSPIAPQQTDPQLSTEEPSSHLSWATARPDAITLVQPAPLWSTEDLRQMLPDDLASRLTHFDDWSKAGGSGRTMPDSISELEIRLKTVRPMASALAAARLGETLALWSGPDASGKATTGRLRLVAAERELAGFTPGDPDADSAVSVLKRLPENAWWDTHDGASLDRLFTLQEHWSPVDSELNGWARVGRPAALYLQHRSSEGLAANHILLTTEWARLTGPQQKDVQWHQGVILSDLKHYQEAIPFVEKAARFPAFHHAADASKLLFSLLLQVNNLKSAEQQFRSYVHDWTPREIQQALMDELEDKRWLLAQSEASGRAAMIAPTSSTRK